MFKYVLWLEHGLSWYMFLIYAKIMHILLFWDEVACKYWSGLVCPFLIMCSCSMFPERGVLKSSEIILNLFTSSSISVCFLYFKAVLLMGYMVRTGASSWFLTLLLLYNVSLHVMFLTPTPTLPDT